MKKLLDCMMLLGISVIIGCAFEVKVNDGDKSEPTVQEVVSLDTGKFIIDNAGVVSDAGEAELNASLKAFQDSHERTQIKVLTVDTVSPDDIVSFSQKTAVSWALGTKGVDNGVLVVVAIGDRKVRVHTGRGMEGVLTDQFCGELCRATAKQFFKQKNYEQGIKHIVTELEKKAGG